MVLDVSEALALRMEAIEENPLSEFIEYTPESYEHMTTANLIVYGFDYTNRDAYGRRHIMLPQIKTGFGAEDTDDGAEISQSTTINIQSLQTPLDIAYSGPEPRRVDETVRREVRTHEYDAIKIDGEAPRNEREECQDLAMQLHTVCYSRCLLDLIDGVNAISTAFMDRHQHLTPFTTRNTNSMDIPRPIIPDDPSNN